MSIRAFQSRSSEHEERPPTRTNSSGRIKVVGKYELSKTLGSGTFSKVKLAVHKDSKERVAVKVVDLAQMAREGMEAQLKKEIAILKGIKHPHVVEMKEVLRSKTHVYIVMELITGGELFDKIVAAKRFDEPTARRYFQQLVSGIEYCHSQGVIHRDLKPENLLVDANDNVKISDFGLSGMTDKTRKMLTTVCGTPHYLAPEVLSGFYEGTSVDVWSCGIILFVMVAGRHPFDDPSVQGLFNKIRLLQFTYPPHFSKELKDFLNTIIVSDPQRRSTIADIIRHPWYRIGLPDTISKPVHVITPSNDDVEMAFTPADESSETDSDAPALSKSTSLNAFSLLARIMTGSMNSLIHPEDAIVLSMGHRNRFCFMTEGTVEEVLEKIAARIRQTKRLEAFKKKKESNEMKVKFKTACGSMDVVFTANSTFESGLALVELNKMSGDTLTFHDFYREMKKHFEKAGQ